LSSMLRPSRTGDTNPFPLQRGPSCPEFGAIGAVHDRPEYLIRIPRINEFQRPRVACSRSEEGCGSFSIVASISFARPASRQPKPVGPGALFYSQGPDPFNRPARRQRAQRAIGVRRRCRASGVGIWGAETRSVEDISAERKPSTTAFTQAVLQPVL